MKVRALTSFVGLVCMTYGEVKDIDDSIAKDLIRAGYVQATQPAEQVKETSEEEKVITKPTKQKKKK